MARSPESIEQRRAYNREMYWWYRDHGICPNCRRAYSEPGRSLCKACARRQKALADRNDPGGVVRNEKLREWRAQKQAEGLCSQCGKNKAVEGRTYCAKCLKYFKEYQQVRRIRERIRRENEKEAR